MHHLPGSLHMLYREFNVQYIQYAKWRGSFRFKNWLNLNLKKKSKIMTLRDDKGNIFFSLLRKLKKKSPHKTVPMSLRIFSLNTKESLRVWPAMLDCQWLSTSFRAHCDFLSVCAGGGEVGRHHGDHTGVLRGEKCTDHWSNRFHGQGAALFKYAFNRHSGNMASQKQTHSSSCHWASWL